MRRFLLLVFTLSCAHTGSGSPDFARFVDDYFAAVNEWRPSEATGLGFHEYDGKLDDFSRTRVEARTAELHRFLDRLTAMNRDAMSFDDQIDADILDGDIRSNLLELEVIRNWEHNPMGYAGVPGGAIDVLMKREFAPAPERLRRALARMEQIPRLYAAARENMKDPPREFTDLAVRMSKGSVGFFEDSVAQWAREAAKGDAALLAQFEAQNKKVIAATREFADWLEKDLLPRSHGHYAIGAETFLRKLRYDEGIDVKLDELLARGEAQLARDRAAFVDTSKQIDAKKSPEDVYKTLEDDHPGEGELIPFVAKSVESAREFVVSHGIVTVPSEVRVKVTETPPFARNGSFASMDTPGPYERKATEAFYYVTPVEKDWDAKHKDEHLRGFNTFVTAMVDVHEAYPGHYLQFLYSPRFPTKTRKLTGCGTNAEGWAHYTEQMMVDHGFGGSDPRMRLAQLEEALLRDCRYVVGIKLHTAGWTVEQGAQLFQEQCFQEPATAYEESRRGAYNPTYLYYTLGKLEIQKLASEYMARGKSLREFHDAFVAQGDVPIPLVRKILMR
jgi:uncharacterized protein (DUF885 family)